MRAIEVSGFGTWAFSPTLSSSTLRSTAAFRRIRGPLRHPFAPPIAPEAEQEARVARYALVQQKPIFPTCVDDGTGIPCQYTGPEPSLSGFGNILPTIGCHELDDAVAKLNLAMARAEKAGVGIAAGASPFAAAYDEAKLFVDKQESFWGRELVAVGSSCTNLVAEANRLLNNLNTGLAQSGFTPVGPSETSQGAGNLLGILGLPSWVLPVAIGGAALFLLAPVMLEALALTNLARAR